MKGDNETVVDDTGNETKEIELPEADERAIIINRPNITISDINITPLSNETIIERNETNTTVILELGDLISTIILEANIDVLKQDIVMPRIEEGGIEISDTNQDTRLEKGTSSISTNDKNRIAEPQDIDNFEFNTPIIALELGEGNSANVELPKLRDEAINMIVKCDDWNYRGDKCDSEWHYYFNALVNFEQDDESVEFNVYSFSAYAGGNYTGGETAWLIIWDENDIGMPNASTNTTNIKLVNETVKFFADYRIAQNGTKITDGNCSISFSDTSGNMTYNSTYTYYLHERNFTSTGNYPYTVSCTHPTYTDLTADDSIVIEAFSNETKGAVSTVTGDVPFYTTDNNPQTCTLRGGENCTVTWNVNATGTIGKVYDFFVEAFGYIMFNYTANVSNNGSDYYAITVANLTNSSHVSMQISVNDTTPPVFVFATATPSAVINGSDVTINANVEDNVQVDSVWANITLPDNSTFFISSLPFVYTTNVSQIGVHTITFYANDTSGNNATTTKTFITAPPINLTMNIDVTLAAGLSSSTTAKVYIAGTKELLSSQLVNGSTSILLPNVLCDIGFDTIFNDTNVLTTLFEFNLSRSVDGVLELSNPTIDPYLVAYGINTTFNFTNAQVTISYANVTFGVESNLRLDKCGDFIVTNGTCNTAFNDVTTDSVTVQDTDNDRFVYNTTSFSGFGIKEVTPPSVEVTADEGGRFNDLGGGCAPGYKLENRKCINIEESEPAPEEEIPEQLFDITFRLEDSIIQSASELSGVVTFESFGTVPTPVGLTFIIIDGAGNEVYREESSITVTTEEVLRWNYETLQALPEGKYTAILETLYNVDVRDEFKQKFEIGPEERVGIPIWIWIIGGVVVILLISSLIWWLTRNNQKQRR